MSVRSLARQLVIHLTTGARLDAAHLALERRLRGRRSAVRVLFFHGTPDARAFRSQLAWLRERFELIDFDTFRTRLEAPAVAAASERHALLLTFDDGFVSNYDIAARALEEAGARGVFFVVPSFSLASPQASRAFFREQLHGRDDRYERAMSPDEIRDLATRGHTIGNHTLSHLRLDLAPAAAYEREIGDAADLIESWIGKRVDAFAWPYVWNGINADAYRLAANRHRYCFSPCAGTIEPGVDGPGLLWRTNAEVDRSFREFRFQCSGLADYASGARRRRLLRLLPAPAGIMRPAPA